MQQRQVCCCADSAQKFVCYCFWQCSPSWLR